MNRIFLGGLVASFVLASSASGQTPEVLLRRDDVIVGVGNIVAFANVAANDPGIWIAHVRTNFSDPPRDEVLVRSGFVTLREGTLLSAPSGAFIGPFHSFDLNDAGHLALNLDLLGTLPADNAGLFWNTLLLIQKGSPTGLPGLGTRIWSGFGTVRMNEHDTLLALAKTKEPGASGAGDDALVRLSVGPTGQLLSTEVLLKRGDALAAVGGDTVTSLAGAEHGLALNDRGDHLVLVKLTFSGWAWILNGDTVLAQDTTPSPLPGINWRTLQNNPRASLNDFGDYAYTGALETTDNRYVIVKNGAIFVRKGDVLPSLAPAAVGDDSPAPIVLTNSGDLFWFAKTDAETDTALMRNHDVVLRRGLSTVDGEPVTGIQQTDGAFDVSRDGRFLIARVTLGTLDALVWVDFGLVVPVPGCAGNPGRLTHEDGEARAGDHLELALDQGQASGVRPFLSFATRAARPASDCGFATPFGELLISTADRIATFPLPPWNGAPVALDIPIPNSVSLVDARLFAQGYFFDPGASAPAERVRLTNGLRIQIGAP